MKEKSIESYVEKIYKDSFDFIDKLNKSIIDFYCMRYKYVEEELTELLSNEPFKIFKNKYLEWINKIKELELEKQDLLKKIKEMINTL